MSERCVSSPGDAIEAGSSEPQSVAIHAGLLLSAAAEVEDGEEGEDDEVVGEGKFLRWRSGLFFNLNT